MAIPSSTTIYVRPGRIITLRCSGHTIFGHGWGDISLLPSSGAVVTDPRDGGNNGFVSWQVQTVTLPEGAVVEAREIYYPGPKNITRYVADRARWRAQRRAGWIAHLARRAFQRARTLAWTTRKIAIERLLDLALSEYDACVATGRSRAARDRKRWARCLAATYCVEIVDRRNIGSGSDGLTSRRIRPDYLAGDLLSGTPPAAVRRALGL